MCGLCGIFGVAEHWTDSAGTSGASLQAERQHRARIANAVLGLYGLRLNEWMGRYTLTGNTGRSAVVDNLGAVWPTAEIITGRDCDPLDETVILALEQQGGEPA